ncbi:MAG: hypothetical protein ACREFO_10095 [Acetobacteraceae bacterium]
MTPSLARPWAPCDFEADPVGEEALWKRAGGLDFVPANARSLLVDEVMPFQDEVSDERSLQKRKTLLLFQVGPRRKCTGHQHSLASRGALDVLHEANIVELFHDAPADVSRPADVKGFKFLFAPAAAEDVDAAFFRQLVQACRIEQTVSAPVRQRLGRYPLNRQSHFRPLVARTSSAEGGSLRVCSAAWIRLAERAASMKQMRATCNWKFRGGPSGKMRHQWTIR